MGHLIYPRQEHFAFLLPDGKVLIIGGEKNIPYRQPWWNRLQMYFQPGMHLRVPAVEAIPSEWGELYDPTTNVFSRCQRFSVVWEASQMSSTQILIIHPDETFSLYYPDKNIFGPTKRFNFKNGPTALHSIRLNDHSLLLVLSYYTDDWLLAVSTSEFDLSDSDSYPVDSLPFNDSQINTLSPEYGPILSIAYGSNLTGLYIPEYHHW